MVLYTDDSVIIANDRMPMNYRSCIQQGVTAYVDYLTSWKMRVNEAKSLSACIDHHPSPSHHRIATYESTAALYLDRMKSAALVSSWRARVPSGRTPKT